MASGQDLNAGGTHADGSTDLEMPLLDDGQSSTHKLGWGEFLRSFAVLGWAAFGGPNAHIGYFQKVFVEQYRWISTNIFVELLALGQCLPGPTSTQMAFALGVSRKGVLGGLASGGLFLFPGLVLMSAVGLGAAQFLIHPSPAVKATVAGLSVTGVALVASGAKGLLFKVCSTKPLALICTAAAVIAYYHNTAWLFPLLLIGGGLITVVMSSLSPSSSADVGDEDEHKIEKFGFSKMWGGIIIGLWALLLVTSLSLRKVFSYEQAAPLYWFELFYRTGSLIFGGGQVVLPLILSEVVKYDCSDPSKGCVESPDSWCTADDFYTGLAAAQAMPGPLFNFSAYLGAVIAKRAGYNPGIGIVLCWLGLFGPGILLIFGVLPFWSKFRHWQLYKKMLPGLNAAAIGLIMSAVITMVFSVTSGSNPFPKAAVVIGVIGFAAVDVVKMPAPAAVILGGALGYLAFLMHLH